MKEIIERKLKDSLDYEFDLSFNDRKELLEYIKDLQKKAELTDHYKHLYSEVKKQKDDGIKYIKEHIKYECDDSFNGMQFYSYHLYDFNKEDILRMLGEIE